jgi:hypothetical protein
MSATDQLHDRCISITAAVLAECTIRIQTTDGDITASPDMHLQDQPAMLMPPDISCPARLDEFWMLLAVKNH